MPPELGALTGLEYLRLQDNQLTGLPAVFQTFAPSSACDLYNNDPSFSCASVGFGTSCCTVNNCGDVGTCFQG